MLNEKLASKLKTIDKELNALSREMDCKIDNVDKKTDPSIALYVAGIKKGHLSFKKVLEMLGDSSEIYKQEIEATGDRTSLDTMRHDMTNPVSVIKGYSEMTLEKSSDQYIVTNIEGVISLANKILELISHIEVKE